MSQFEMVRSNGLNGFVSNDAIISKRHIEIYKLDHPNSFSSLQINSEQLIYLNPPLHLCQNNFYHTPSNEAKSCQVAVTHQESLGPHSTSSSICGY